jgi:hypothetical protein
MSTDELQVLGDHHITLNEVCAFLDCCKVSWYCVLRQEARSTSVGCNQRPVGWQQLLLDCGVLLLLLDGQC